MEKEIPVFFAIDDSYAPFLAVALNSAVQHISKSRNYNITVLYQKLSDENIKKLKKYEKKNFKIDFIKMNGELKNFKDTKNNRFRDDYVIAIYFRLFIASMFPNIDKAIYLDSDIVINTDIAELYSIDIKDNLVGACYDTTISHNKDFYTYVEKAVGVKKGEYINSGILLMNLKEMRNLKFEEHFLYLLHKYGFDTIAPDQDYINAICNGTIYYLDKKWNTMPNDKQLPSDKPYIIHFNLFSKPWHYSEIQYEEYFWKNAVKSGYLDEILEIRNSFDNEKQENDKERLNKLIERAKKITENKVTFNSLFKEGEKIRI